MEFWPYNETGIFDTRPRPVHYMNQPREMPLIKLSRHNTDRLTNETETRNMYDRIIQTAVSVFSGNYSDNLIQKEKWGSFLTGFCVACCGAVIFRYIF
jgi:hypothetical protein